jgi:hypothetical protein
MHVRWRNCPTLDRLVFIFDPTEEGFFMSNVSALSRRGCLIGVTSTALCAPAIVQAASLMPVRGLIMPINSNEPLQSNYKVISYENFHVYHKEDDFPSERGVFSTWDEALLECKRIVDDQLHECCEYRPGISANELYTLIIARTDNGPWPLSRCPSGLS